MAKKATTKNTEEKRLPGRQPLLETPEQIVEFIGIVREAMDQKAGYEAVAEATDFTVDQCRSQVASLRRVAKKAGKSDPFGGKRMVSPNSGGRGATGRDYASVWDSLGLEDAPEDEDDAE